MTQPSTVIGKHKIRFLWNCFCLVLLRREGRTRRLLGFFGLVKSCSVAKSHPTLCDSMNCSIPASLPFTVSPSLLKLMSIESMMPSEDPQRLHGGKGLPSGCQPSPGLPASMPRFSLFLSRLALWVFSLLFWSTMQWESRNGFTSLQSYCPFEGQFKEL